MTGEKIVFIGSATRVEVDPLFGIAFYPEGLEYDTDEHKRITSFLRDCGVNMSERNCIGGFGRWMQDGKRFKITVESID